jgi:hypothetical protein
VFNETQLSDSAFKTGLMHFTITHARVSTDLEICTFVRFDSKQQPPQTTATLNSRPHTSHDLHPHLNEATSTSPLASPRQDAVIAISDKTMDQPEGRKVCLLQNLSTLDPFPWHTSRQVNNETDRWLQLNILDVCTLF